MEITTIYKIPLSYFDGIESEKAAIAAMVHVLSKSGVIFKNENTPSFELNPEPEGLLIPYINPDEPRYLIFKHIL